MSTNYVFHCPRCYILWREPTSIYLFCHRWMCHAWWHTLMTMDKTCSCLVLETNSCKIPFFFVSVFFHIVVRSSCRRQFQCFRQDQLWHLQEATCRWLFTQSLGSTLPLLGTGEPICWYFLQVWKKRRIKSKGLKKQMKAANVSVPLYQHCKNICLH